MTRVEAPEIIFKPCNTTNYRSGRKGNIKYIVIHYTAGNGDTAAGNANYFANTRDLQASAHYFVDENKIYQSVKDGDTAWHCGAKSYKHAECRNANAIGIEICSRKNAAGYYFRDEAVANAVTLTKWLMEKYGIDINHVVRHYDVTGKNCPAPFVTNEGQWVEFKNKLVKGAIDLALDKWMVEGGQAAVKGLANKGLLLNPEQWGKEEVLEKPFPTYLAFMMLDRLAERIEGGR